MMVTKRNIEEYLIDAGLIYAKASASFNFFRRRAEKLPTDITWDQVRSGLRNMFVYDTSYPDVYARIDQLATLPDAINRTQALGRPSVTTERKSPSPLVGQSFNAVSIRNA